MTNRYHLTPQELDELEYEHRHTSDKRYADRLKAVYLLGRGWQVSKAFATITNAIVKLA